MRGIRSASRRRGLAFAGCGLATVAGVLAAVAVSGAGEERARGSITIAGDSEKILTIIGSNFSDQATISHTQGMPYITISGSSPSNQRKGCDPVVKGKTYRCETDGLEKIGVSLGNGGDTLEFAGDGLGSWQVRGSTGAGSDRLTGSPAPETLKGGSERDRLEGGDGDDSLDGGPDRDQLDGGKGNDKCDRDPEDKSVVRCETTHLRR